jgi:shikimate kinase
VLALGGGAVVDDHVRASLVSHRVVFLDVGLANAAARVGLNRDRPLLLGNPRATLRVMLEARRPLYDEVATATVLTDDRSPDEVADDVEAVL